MIKKEQLVDLYLNQNKSMQEVADFFQCSLNQVQYWMTQYKIKSRSRSCALYLKHNPAGDPFALKKKLTRKDLVLLGLGLGLWWGEGSKRHYGTIRLGNTDPQLIKKFVLFLREICGVEMRKIRFGLQIFSDMDVKKVKRFWFDILKVSSEQFLPTVVITKAKSLGTYRFKSKYGVLTIYCANIKLRKLLADLMKKYTGVLF